MHSMLIATNICRYEYTTQLISPAKSQIFKISTQKLRWLQFEQLFCIAPV